MSKLAHQLILTQYRKVSRSLMLTLALLLPLCSSAGAVEKQIDPQIAERKEFIQKAMEENEEKVRKEMAAMSKRGIRPMMIVTTLRPFGDWDFYYVEGGSIRWQPNVGQKFQPVEVPEGFVTDLTSIPRVFWQKLRPEGRYAYAAVVHDYLYWVQTRSREEADQILKMAMEDSKVDPKLVNTIYLAVRKFGQTAWDNNARQRKAGERRFLKLYPEDFTTSWSEWKTRPGVFADEPAEK